MKTSNKLILLIFFLLIGLVPLSVYFFKSNYEKFDKTKNSINREINCIVVEGQCEWLNIGPGKNTIGDYNWIKDSVSFEYRKDTMFIRERNPTKSRTTAKYGISLNLTKCPNIIAHDGIEDLYINGFNVVKNNLQLKLSGGILRIDSLTADSIFLELHQGQWTTLGKTSKFNFVSIKATDSSSITLECNDIKTIKAAIEPSVNVNGLMRNINKLTK
ncbi:hypothetical protein [Solitalea koreensis]|uniref:Uncharacterized protein n=1 Tax=Solitalea koreensis TaxID=543615 RepID=A0A521AFH4_9SPHI|nr:hypothetical protein [Solitalea koreensis]SMO33541.1 hypothetical protein SAMN06265350_101107 [Solitalea koreensis]